MFITKCTGGWILSTRFWTKATEMVPLHLDLALSLSRQWLGLNWRFLQ